MERGPFYGYKRHSSTRQIAEIARAAVRAGAANAGGEKRAFRPAARDPRWVPNPARPSRCRRVLLDRVPPAHAGLCEPLPGLSNRSGITRRRITRCSPGQCRRGARTATAAESLRPLDRSLRSPGQQFAPAQLTRAGKNAPSALPLATRAGSPTQRGHHAAGAFYPIESRPLTLACANRCPGSRADLEHISKNNALPSRAVPVLGGRARLERATCRGASLRRVPAKLTEAGKPARRFPRRVRSL